MLQMYMCSAQCILDEVTIDCMFYQLCCECLHSKNYICGLRVFKRSREGKGEEEYRRRQEEEWRKERQEGEVAMC